MAGIFGRIKQKFSKASDEMDKYQEAITFAEAGEAEHALAAVSEQTEEQQTMQLLVVGRESTFSKEILDYALDMAQRMSYEILALNTAPLSCDTFKLFSNSRDQLCEEFKSLSEKNAAMFPWQHFNIVDKILSCVMTLLLGIFQCVGNSLFIDSAKACCRNL